MKETIVKYERMGTAYVALNASGRPVGIITEVRSVNTAKRRVKR